MTVLFSWHAAPILGNSEHARAREEQSMSQTISQIRAGQLAQAYNLAAARGWALAPRPITVAEHFCASPHRSPIRRYWPGPRAFSGSKMAGRKRLFDRGQRGRKPRTGFPDSLPAKPIGSCFSAALIRQRCSATIHSPLCGPFRARKAGGGAGDAMTTDSPIAQRVIRRSESLTVVVALRAARWHHASI